MRILKGALLTLAAISAVTQQSFAQGGYYKGLFTAFAVGNMYMKDGFDYVADGGNGAVAGLAGYSMTSGSQQYSAYLKAANVKNSFSTTATREVTAAGMMIAPMGSTGIEFGSGASYSDFDGDLSNNAKFGAGFRWKTGSLLMNLTGGYNTNLLNSGNAFDMGGVAEYQYGRISLIGNYGATATDNGKNNFTFTGGKDALRYVGGSIDYRFKFRLPMVARVSFQGTTSPTVVQTRSMVSLRTALSGNAGTLNSLSQSPWPTNLGVWSSLGF